MAMTFNNIHRDINFRCTDDAKEDIDNEYARAVVGETMKDSDLLSKWEENKKNVNDNNIQICKRKGLSIDLIKASNQKIIEETYRATSDFKTKLPRFKSYCVIKFLKNSGKVWNDKSPSKSHRTFFKSDKFNNKLVVIVETIRL